MSLADQVKNWKGGDKETTTTTSTESINANNDDVMAISDAGISDDGEGGRAFFQGLTFGFADEIEAYAASALWDDRPYEEIRDEIRGKLKKYQQENPGVSLTIEMIGAAAPTVAMLLAAPFTGGSSAAMAGQNLARIGIGQLAKRGGIQGGIAGLGYSEAETLPGQAVDAGIGTIFGAVATPTIVGVGNKITNKADALMNFMRNKFGARPSSAAMNEIQRLAKGTNKTVDEIVQDIADGKILAENRTLAAAVRAIYSKDSVQAGTSAGKIQKGLESRRIATQEKALKELEDVLYPGASSKNVFASIDLDDEVLRTMQSTEYRAIFNEVGTVGDDIATRMESLFKSYPKLAKELEKYTNEGNLVPLFKVGRNGELQMIKNPTLEQADVFYRLMRDEAGARWAASKGTSAKPLTDATDSFKKMLDNKYPNLKAARDAVAGRKQGKDAFRAGIKAFGGNADEIAYEFSKMSPDAQNKFRAGVLAAIKNKANRTMTSLGKAADVTKHDGQILKIVLGKDYEKQVQKALDVAGESQEAVQRVLKGSMTQPQAAAEKAIGGGLTLTDVVTAFNGDPIAITAAIGRKLANKGTPLKPRDYEQVVDFLFETNPKVVRDILNDKISGGQLQEIVRNALRVATNQFSKTSRVGVGGVLGYDQTNPDILNPQPGRLVDAMFLQP